MQDGCFSHRGKRTTRSRVFLINLDDASMNALQKPAVFLSPELAKAVTYFKQEGASAIGLDLIIPEGYAGLVDVGPEKSGDATTLGNAIMDAGNVVLPVWKLSNGWLHPLPQWRLKHFLDPSPADQGFVNLTMDDDLFLRRQQPMVTDKSEGEILQFSLALLAQATGLEIKAAADGVRVGDELLPLDSESKLRINFVGPPGTFPVIAFRDVLDAAAGKKSLREHFRNSVVIIGAMAQSQQDYHATPYANNYWGAVYSRPAGLMSGGEIHANIFATLVDRAYIYTLPPYVSLALLLCMGVVLGKAFASLNLAWGLLLAVVQHLGWKLIALESFTWFSLRVEMMPMLLLGALTYGVTFLLRWWTLRRMFGVVKSEAIARMLENDPSQLDLRGEERIATVLFADIRSFTDFSEKHAARQVVELLNTYFTAIVPIIEKHGGTLNQYMGDGIMVIFNAPAPCPEHALHAVRAATALVRKVEEMRETWTRLDFPAMRIGVGIHTGRVVAGTVGSPRRLDYSAIGDTVNTAARLEAKTKDFKTAILISAETYRELPIAVRLPLGCNEEAHVVELRNRAIPVHVHIVAVEAPANATS